MNCYSRTKNTKKQNKTSSSLELGGGLHWTYLLAEVGEAEVRVVLSLPEDDVVVGRAVAHEALVVVQRVQHRSVDVESAQGVAHPVTVVGVLLGSAQGGAAAQRVRVNHVHAVVMVLVVYVVHGVGVVVVVVVVVTAGYAGGAGRCRRLGRHRALLA